MDCEQQWREDNQRKVIFLFVFFVATYASFLYHGDYTECFEHFKLFKQCVTAAEQWNVGSSASQLLSALVLLTTGFEGELMWWKIVNP